MLIALAFILVGHADPGGELLQVRPEHDQACVTYLDRLLAIERAPLTEGVHAYFYQSRQFLREVRADLPQLTIRREVLKSAQGVWITRVGQELHNRGFARAPTLGPWTLDRDTLLHQFPDFERFVPKHVDLFYDPFYLLRENAMAQVNPDEYRLVFPVEFMDPTQKHETLTTLAHEKVHLDMIEHPLSLFFTMDGLTAPFDLPLSYRTRMSSEELFTFTVDVINRLRLERKGIHLLNSREQKERSLRAIVAYILNDIHPKIAKATGKNSTRAESAYIIPTPSIIVTVQDTDTKRTMLTDIKEQVNLIAEAARDLQRRLDAPGDREESLIEFLRQHQLNPDAYLL